MINRFGPPHKFDHAPKDSYCRVDKGDSFDVYIQRSDNDEDPKWEFIDNFTEDSYKLYTQINS